MKLLQVTEQNKPYYSADYTKGFNDGAKAQYEADKKEAERRGRWIDIEHAPNGLLYVTCSVCGKRQTVETTNYCGNCGADMREKKNECDDCFVPMFYNLEDDDSICMDCGVEE